MRLLRKHLTGIGALAVAGMLAMFPTLALADGAPFIAQFTSISTVASTVPENGDVNPYGVFVVPHSTGNLVAGDIMVSNFNNGANLQGTGTTLVQVAPNGNMSLFAQINAKKLPGPCPGGVGLTTALVVLSSGWVIVGSLPTADGTAATAQAGCLLVLDSRGRVRETISGEKINGPWDMTVADNGDGAPTLFVTNVLNGTVAAGGKVVHGGTVLRIELNTPNGGVPQVSSITEIGSGFSERTDPNALVIGPTGVGLSKDGTLYVADSLNNRIAAIPDALTRGGSADTGTTISMNGHLDDPLGLAIAPNGDILTANGDDGNLVETAPSGKQVAFKRIDSLGSPPGAGDLFGIAVVPLGAGVYFVDDGTNTLNLLS